MPMIPLRDHHRLPVRIIGRGSPVLMLHGLGMESRHWLPWITPFLHRHRFILPDFRGAGRAATVPFNAPHDIFQNLMEDVEDIISHLKLHDFALVGYSLGGSTGLHLLANGDFSQVNRYLHIDQSPCIRNGHAWPHGLFGREQATFFSELTELNNVLKMHAGASTLGQLPPAAYEHVVRLLADLVVALSEFDWLKPVLMQAARMPSVFCRWFPLTDLDVLRAYLESYLEQTHDYREALRDCRVPVTVFAGKRSPLYSLDGQAAIRQYAPRARLVGFEQSGHMPMVNEPGKFTREFARFLRGD